VAQVAEYIERLEEAVATEEDFADSREKIAKDANTLIVLALALGIHDTDNPHKAGAGSLMKAAAEMAGVEDFAAATTALAAVKAAAIATDNPGEELEWKKVAALPELMKKVPTVNTRLKSYMRSESRFDSKIDDLAGLSATLAVIGQSAMADTEATENAEQVVQWRAFCTQMRDAAGALNAAIHAEDFAAATAANTRLQKNCEDCHAIFHIEEDEP